MKKIIGRFGKASINIKLRKVWGGDREKEKKGNK